MKTPKITEEFSQTEAYSILFMKLATDDTFAANFINSVIPQDMEDHLPPKSKNKSGTPE